MPKYLFLLVLLASLTQACSARQKRICTQNVAYQHGYQAAQKGESVDNASTYEGNVCQDFEAYSPTMYRSDFKAGYFKGKKEYCSEFNYTKWGKEDGLKGKTDYPNNYSVDMKICLQDSEYKKLAKSAYNKAFNEAYCNDGRLAELGTSQAKAFSPLKVPDVKKRCGKQTKSMVAAMRASYKEQMKTNCTVSFWLLKGEEDAVAKRSKATELAKVQKCKSSIREKLMSNYSKSYNERKTLLIEEEKLAMEKKKQQQMLELEKQRQQREYELAKERNQIERDRVNNESRPILVGGGSGAVSGSHIFYQDGNKLRSRCWVDQKRHVGTVRVKNLSNRHTSFSGTWKIRYYDFNNRLIKTEDEYEYLSLSGYEEESFKDNFAPWEASRCTARLR